jgi:hypothetical protein
MDEANWRRWAEIGHSVTRLLRLQSPYYLSFGGLLFAKLRGNSSLTSIEILSPILGKGATAYTHVSAMRTGFDSKITALQVVSVIPSLGLLHKAYASPPARALTTAEKYYLIVAQKACWSAGLRALFVVLIILKVEVWPASFSQHITNPFLVILEFFHDFNVLCLECVRWCRRVESFVKGHVTYACAVPMKRHDCSALLLYIYFHPCHTNLLLMLRFSPRRIC